MKEQSSVPALRFPEFINEWQPSKLGQETLFISSGLSKDQNSDGKGYPVTRIETISNGSINLDKVGFVETSEDISNYKLKVGDLLFSNINSVSQIGKMAYVNKNNDLHHGMNLLRIRFTPEHNALFFFYSLTRPKTKKHFMRICNQAINQASINQTDLKKTKLFFPVQLEQEKIAAFLGAVDEKITQLSKKKDLLEEYKKGMMQKIFSLEIRFKDDKGNNFPDWEEQKLSSFLVPEIREIEKPDYNYTAIGVRSHCKGTFQKPDFDPDSIAMEKLYVVKENDLIVNITFAWEGAIALVGKEDEGGLVSHRFPTYTFNRKKVLHEFFGFVFPQKRFRYILDLVSPGGAGRNRVLSKKEFLKIKWKIPSVPEQKKIADFLSSLDQKIDATDKQLKAAQDFKKGLLQQMFV